MAFLSPRALNGLRTYKYKPAGYTLLDDIHQPFWNGEAMMSNDQPHLEASIPHADVASCVLQGLWSSCPAGWRPIS